MEAKFAAQRHGPCRYRRVIFRRPSRTVDGLLEYISTSFEQHDARIEVARLGAKDLVETNWPAVQAVARELLSKKKLSRAEVKAIVLRCDEEQYAEIDRKLGLV